MITAALYQYLLTNSGAASIYPNQAPFDAALPALIIDKIGDTRDRAWQSGVTSRTTTRSEFELTVWADTQISALNECNDLITSLDDFQGQWADGLSPETTHRILLAEAEDNGWQFNAERKKYSASLFLTILHD